MPDALLHHHDRFTGIVDSLALSVSFDSINALATPTARDTAAGSVSSINDGNDSTEHDGSQPMVGSWIALDLHGVYAVGSMRLLQSTAPGTGWFATAYNVQTSTDGTTWTNLISHSAVAQDETFTIPTTSSQYWRLIVSAGGTFGWNVSTWKLFAG